MEQIVSTAESLAKFVEEPNILIDKFKLKTEGVLDCLGIEYAFRFLIAVSDQMARVKTLTRSSLRYRAVTASSRSESTPS